MAYLSRAMAASDHFPKVSRELGLRHVMQSACTLSYTREGVQTFRSLGAFNQDANASKSRLAGIWATELESLGRVTNDLQLPFENPVMGMLMACQSDEWYGQVQEESQSRVGKPDTGFGLRFLTLPLENTRPDNEEPELRTEEPEEEEAQRKYVTSTVADLHCFLQRAKYIKLAPEAADLYVKAWYPWIGQQDLPGKWLNGYRDKANPNVLRVSWAFRCIELFEAISARQTPGTEDIHITASAMERAIEFCKLATYSAKHCQITVGQAEANYRSQKEAEKAASIQNSKWAATFNQPALLTAWVKECQKAGKTQRSAIRSINSSTRRKLKAELDLDIEAIVSKYWDAA